ncbi:hypothetical protein FQN57_007440 [Myotisia sp. PD_48]|nr:hypothetical protein FQN57_007440 [Myotisia sp. PD_48]
MEATNQMYASRQSSCELGAKTPPTPSLDESKQQKREEILEACTRRDTACLMKLASSEGGLLQDEIRQVAWPILQGYDPDEQHEELTPWESLPSHGDEYQVKLDVNRSFVHYPNCKTEKHLEAKRSELLDLITSLLRRNPMLCYFQGYHDIAQVLLLVLGRKGSYPALVHMSLFRIRDYMLPSLSPALRHLHLIPAIIKCVDGQLWKHLAGTQPFFALAATLTLYAHDIPEYIDIARLYDFILAHEPVVSIYLFATIVLARKDELLDIPIDEPEMIHGTLSKLPQPLDLEAMISQTLELFYKFPPEKLPQGAWRTISSHSVLKTLRDPTLRSTKEEAGKHFQQQVRGLRQEERYQRTVVLYRKHARSIGFVGAAILVGAVSYWISRRDFDANKLFWNCLRLKSFSGRK